MVNSILFCKRDCLHISMLRVKRIGSTKNDVLWSQGQRILCTKFNKIHLEKLSNKNKWIVVRSLTFSLPVFMHVINLIRFHLSMHSCVCVLDARETYEMLSHWFDQWTETAAFSVISKLDAYKRMNGICQLELDPLNNKNKTKRTKERTIHTYSHIQTERRIIMHLSNKK